MTAEEYERLANEGGKHAAMFRGMAKWCREQEVVSKFTDDDKTIIRSLRRGHPRAEIAMRLAISEAMVSRRILNIWQMIDEPRTNDAGLVFALGRRGLLV
ncbi:C-terminal effector signal transduction response regulator-like superfamily protein [Agrobacterium phage Milano]|nr:C-terminal effector signal transduction response regulator-like superfamily protein [Agrobacterium phage Milano]